MRVLLLTTMLVAAPMAQAADWRIVGRSHDGQVTYLIDVSEIRIQGEIRHAWVKRVPVPHTLKGPSKNPATFVSYDLTLAAYNCTEEAYRDEEVVIYFEDGTTDHYHPQTLDAENEEWSHGPPDSIASQVLKSVCSSGKR
jgi:hypothetical protein